MNNPLPRISIITPSYNQERFIEETILSVLNQSYPNIEYILVDGGSTDRTMEVLNEYKDKIDIVVYKNRGPSDAINKGLKLATGELAGWINADDILYPKCIEQIVKLYRENTSAAIFYGACLNLINKDGKVYTQKKILINSLSDLLNNDYHLIQQSSFYNTDYLKRVQYIDETVHYSMDLDLWLKLLKLGPVVHYDAHPLAAFRIVEGLKGSTTSLHTLTGIQQILKRHHASHNCKNFRRLQWYALRWQIKKELRNN